VSAKLVVGVGRLPPEVVSYVRQQANPEKKRAQQRRYQERLRNDPAYRERRRADARRRYRERVAQDPEYVERRRENNRRYWERRQARLSGRRPATEA
jgi:hypothetical protein